MSKKFMIFAVMLLLFAVLATQPFASALTFNNVKAWQWFSDTEVDSVAVGDVDGDGTKETVSGGVYRSGTYGYFFGQLCVWSGSTLTLEDVATWQLGVGVEATLQYINSVALGDVDLDGAVEIVTGGYFYDGSRVVAQLRVWSGSSLALENEKTWYWTSNTVVNSVAVSDVDGDGQKEIVSGGYYYDGHYNAQLCVWSATGSTLALEVAKGWRWGTATYINSVALGNVDGDGSLEVVTGGYYYDGVREVAQLCVWSGSGLALENVVSWYWTDDTEIQSVAIGNTDGLVGTEIVTGGAYFDGARHRAQLCVWNGATLALKNVQAWHWTGDTYISSVALAKFNPMILGMDIVTGGFYWDGSSGVAQLCDWSGVASFKNVNAWKWGIGTTSINSVAAGDVDADGVDEVVTGGLYGYGQYTGSTFAQLCVWT